MPRAGTISVSHADADMPYHAPFLEPFHLGTFAVSRSRVSVPTLSIAPQSLSVSRAAFAVASGIQGTAPPLTY